MQWIAQAAHRLFIRTEPPPKFDVGHATSHHRCPSARGAASSAGTVATCRRLTWLATHTWPASVHTYSLVAVAGPNDMSAVLRPFADILSRTEPANDGLVVASDAIVPGSTLLGYAHADHLAVAMPFGQRAAAGRDADDAQRLSPRRAAGSGDPVCRGGFAARSALVERRRMVPAELGQHRQT